MYILIERNVRGNLEIKQSAFNRLLKIAITHLLNKSVNDVSIETEIYRENFLHVLVKLNLKSSVSTNEIDEKKVVNQVEDVVAQTLSIKPKNIAIAYKRR